MEAITRDLTPEEKAIQDAESEKLVKSL
jgi:hypothetical protein